LPHLAALTRCLSDHHGYQSEARASTDVGGDRLVTSLERQRLDASQFIDSFASSTGTPSLAAERVAAAIA
jgi:hypothetical protein